MRVFWAGMVGDGRYTGEVLESGLWTGIADRLSVLYLHPIAMGIIPNARANSKSWLHLVARHTAHRVNEAVNDLVYLKAYL